MAIGWEEGGSKAFSDGVIAIIITSMVLELKVPYESIPGAGVEAYSLPDDEGGWRASALTDHLSMVRLVGGTASRARTVTFLRQLLQRNK
jgi:hypothetical protein